MVPDGPDEIGSCFPVLPSMRTYVRLLITCAHPSPGPDDRRRGSRASCCRRRPRSPPSPAGSSRWGRCRLPLRRSAFIRGCGWGRRLPAARADPGSPDPAGVADLGSGCWSVWSRSAPRSSPSALGWSVLIPRACSDCTGGIEGVLTAARRVLRFPPALGWRPAIRGGRRRHPGADPPARDRLRRPGSGTTHPAPMLRSPCCAPAPPGRAARGAGTARHRHHGRAGCTAPGGSGQPLGRGRSPMSWPWGR